MEPQALADALTKMNEVQKKQILALLPSDAVQKVLITALR
jgi:hypothetical protein